MKKIIYFDSWTQGIELYHHFNEILQSSYTTMLLHVESMVVPYFESNIDTSWYVAKPEQIISGILCKDVSAYNNLSIFEILKQESPKVVVMLSISHIQNRIVTIACKQLGIKVAYLMHGAIRNLENAQIFSQTKSKTYRFKFAYKFKKVFKFLKFLREYHYASRNIMETIHIACQLFIHPHKFVWAPSSHPSLEVDKAFVYLPSDIHLVSSVYKVPRENCVVIGNTKLDHFITHTNKIKSKKTITLLYIEGFKNTSGEFSDLEQKELLKFLYNVSVHNKIHFIIRLHPGTNRNEFIRKFGEGYTFTPKEDSLLDSMNRASIITGQGSTALLESIAYKIPTISIAWYKDSLQHLDFFPQDIGIVRKKEEFENIIGKFINKGWIQEKTRNLLFPGGQTPARQRIVQEIQHLIES